jgi:hypothetical protein
LLEPFDRDTRLLVLDQTWWSANPLGMLWPVMDAAFVMSGGGNGGPSAATRRPVVSGLQTPGNRGILATLPTASGRCWIAGLCFTRSL